MPGNYNPYRKPNPIIRLENGSNGNGRAASPPARGTVAHEHSSHRLHPIQSYFPSQRSRSRARPFYNNSHRTESTERLIPPARARTRSRGDGDSPLRSPGASSRTSWDSESLASLRDPFASPLDDSSRSPSRAESDGGDEQYFVSTEMAALKYRIVPEDGLLVAPEDVEKDDYLHAPDGRDKVGRDCVVFTRRGALNVGALLFLTLGVLMLFVGYPIFTALTKWIDPGLSCHTNLDCLADDLPLLRNVRTGLIDPDTPQSVMTRTAVDGSAQTLVFSDEFNTDGRSFYPGDDPYFQGVDLWYGATQDLEWYDPDAITTEDGTLNIQFDKFSNHGLDYRSGMLQSWNQLCFKGGFVEASISLAGSGSVSGFWPGFWTMGNLARPGYVSTTDGLWPYSYGDTCDVGITANQSSTDGTNYLPGIRYPACTCYGEDHPNGSSGGKTRTAPEIDVLEASVGSLNGVNNGQVSQSAQIAPFDVWYYPNYDFVEVYDNSITSINGYTGGPYQQALSSFTNLNNEWYNGAAYQTYGFEYTPGDTGYVSWFVGANKTWTLDGRAIGPNGNVGQRPISNEPMSLVMNLGMGSSFAPIDFKGLLPLLPATMRFDYVRIYQGDGHHVTCDPPDYPTTDFIANHPTAYLDPQRTKWSETGYSWPSNSFVDGC